MLHLMKKQNLLTLYIFRYISYIYVFVLCKKIATTLLEKQNIFAWLKPKT